MTLGRLPRATCLAMACVTAALAACDTGSVAPEDPFSEAGVSADEALIAGPDCTDTDLCIGAQVRPQCGAAIASSQFAYATYQRFDVPRAGTYSLLRLALRRLGTVSTGSLRVRIVEFPAAGSHAIDAGTTIATTTVLGSLIPAQTRLVTLRFSPLVTLGTANAGERRYALVVDAVSGRLTVGVGCADERDAYPDGEAGVRRSAISGGTTTDGPWKVRANSLAFAVGNDGAPQGPCANAPGATCDDNNATGGDGCGSDCQVEGGWNCVGYPSVCSPLLATGGTISFADGFVIHRFTSSGTFQALGTSLGVEVLVIGGGGGGGGYIGGGGGGGGWASIAAQPVGANESIAVVVGDGGEPGNGTTGGWNGGNSSFASITAVGGGGGGGGEGAPGLAGGSGGGAGRAGRPSTPGAGTGGQGNAGGPGSNGACTDGVGAGGGGGGIGGSGGAASGCTGGAGADGIASTFSGTSVVYAAGGGGGAYNGTGGAGGSGVGGTASGGFSGSAPATAGAPNTGSGGGAGGYPNNQLGGRGGSGIVIVRYHP